MKHGFKFQVQRANQIEASQKAYCVTAVKDNTMARPVPMIVPVRVSRPPPASPRNPTRQHKSLVTIDDYKEPFLASQCRKPLLYPT
jgi:hypothetical protein